MSRIDSTDLPDTTEALLKRLWRHALLVSGQGDIAVDLVRAACARAMPGGRRASGEPRRDVRHFAALHAIWAEEVRPEGRPPADADLGRHGLAAHIPASPLFAAEVLREVSALAEPYREAVVLTYGEGLSYGETAAVLGGTACEVAGLLATARLALATADREHGGAGPDPVSSATLTAYIDQEMDPSSQRGLEQDLETTPGLRDHLAVLRSGERPFRLSFDALLDTAPSLQLAAILAGLATERDLDASGRAQFDARRSADGLGSPGGWLAGIGGGRSWRHLWPILAGVALGAGGGLAVGSLGHGMPWGLAAEPVDVSLPANWQEAVVGTIALVSPEDVAVGRDRVPADSPQLALVQERLGFDLSKVTTLDGLTLKRVHLLRFRSTPIAELAYLTAFGNLVVLCIAAEPGLDRVFETREIKGSKVVTWSRDGLSFMVAGERDEGALRADAEGMRRKL